jgi:hypothetical protein
MPKQVRVIPPSHEQQAGHLMQTAEQEDRQMLRKREMDRLKVAAPVPVAAAEEANTTSTSTSTRTSTKPGETLALTTKHGPIRIVMRPD